MSSRASKSAVATTLELDSSRPGSLLLRLNRPERLNAINEVMVRELGDTCTAIASDPRRCAWSC